MATLSYATETDDELQDWRLGDVDGANYDSYFITAFKVHGQGQKKFQSNYVVLFSKTVTGGSGFIRTRWDYNSDVANERFSRQEQIYSHKAGTHYSTKRLWPRGQGLALQIHVYSNTNSPFNVIGYSMFETANASV